MKNRPKVLAFAGSARRGSLNKILIKAVADKAEKAGAEVEVVDLANFSLPLYDGDIEANQGLPENAVRLQRLFLDHQGLLIACPEYNSSITPLLKNTIDWVSRATNELPTSACFRGKLVSLVSASPGALGGSRGLLQVRSILASIGCLVLPRQQAISRAANAFDSAGALCDADQDTALDAVAHELVETLQRLIAGSAGNA